MIQLYTSEEFPKAKSRQKLPLQCKHCGKTFYQGKNRILAIMKGTCHNTGDFCSSTCGNLYYNPPIFVKCEQCGKEFKKIKANISKTKHNFCCHSCACTYSNTHKTKGSRVSKLEIWLQKKLPELHPNLEFHFNRKDAINSELDIYIPSLRLAFELNGIFHYEPIFGGDKLDNIQNNDSRKFAACLEQGIELCIIDTSKQTYFKEKTAMKFLKIIQDIILLRIRSDSDESV